MDDVEPTKLDEISIDISEFALKMAFQLESFGCDKNTIIDLICSHLNKRLSEAKDDAINIIDTTLIERRS